MANEGFEDILDREFKKHRMDNFQIKPRELEKTN